MGVHDLGFRGYSGERSSVLSRIYMIAKTDVKRFFKSWKFLILYTVCIAPALFQLFLLYLRFIVFKEENGGRLFGRFLKGGDGSRDSLFGRGLYSIEFYFNVPLSMGMLLTLIFSGIVGASMISKDRRAGALELYFTRGIRPVHYFLGKWFAVVFMMLSQLLFPYLFVWICAVLMSPDWGYLEITAGFIPQLILAQVFFCGSLGFLVTAQSSSTDSPPFSIIRWVGGIFGLWFVAAILRKMLHQNDWLALSPWNAAKRIAETIAGAEAGRSFDPIYAWIVMGSLLVIAAIWVRKFMRPVEVVG